MLGPVAQWYRDELREQGHPHLADGLTGIISDPQLDGLKLAGEMDRIKGEVKDPTLKARLREFDCALQSNAEIEEV